jgi:hypothetical protein
LPSLYGVGKTNAPDIIHCRVTESWLISCCILINSIHGFLIEGMNVSTGFFKDAKQQAVFDKEGFIKVPFLNAAQVDEVVKLFNETRQQHATVATLHHTTTDTYLPDLIYKVDAKIKEVFAPELEKIFTNYKTLVGSFHIKEPGPGSATGTHQDPTFVDEPKYSSANIWVALHDIDTHNGNLFFVNGSNKAITSLRVTPNHPSYYQSFYQSLPGLSTQVPLKKGEAVIFNNATIHGATDNLSNDIRLACTMLVCNKEADWLLYYQERGAPNDKIEKYVLDLDTFISMPKDSRPEQKAFSKFISYEYPQLTLDEFLKRVGKAEKPAKSYLERIREVFRIKDSV